jgi:hypothetical protein
VRGVTLAAVLAALFGCSGAGGELPRDEPPGGDRSIEERAVPGRAKPRPAGPAADEATARRILATHFRAAGLRIVADVPLRESGVALVVDGYDPARRIGYEYIAPEEEGIELDRRERAQLSRLGEIQLLVLSPRTAEEIERDAERFLAGRAR